MVFEAVFPMFGLKMRNWVWLNTLNISMRNSIALFSVILKCFSSVMSKFSR